jgi:integrase
MPNYNPLKPFLCANMPAVRTYGTGSLRLRKSKRHPQGRWWLRYYTGAGQREENSHFCECHGSRGRAKAEQLLARRTVQATDGNLPAPRQSKTLVSDLADLLLKTIKADRLRKIPEGLPEPTLQWRRAEADRVINEQRARWDKHLAPVFGDRKAALVTKADINQYVSDRLAAKARHATVNREVAFLKRAYRLGHEARPRLINDVPPFPTPLAESPRKGFIEDATFEKLLAAIVEPGLRGLVLTAYRLGFRKAELKNLLVMQLSDGWLRLFAGATKNGKARSVKLPDDVRAALELCAKGKQPDDYLFTWPSGRRIKDFRGAWNKAVQAAGVPNLIFHDLRRSAVRRLRRRGIPTATAMLITGHLTRAVFDEYDAANAQDVADAAGKI